MADTFKKDIKDFLVKNKICPVCVDAITYFATQTGQNLFFCLKTKSVPSVLRRRLWHQHRYISTVRTDFQTELHSPRLWVGQAGIFSETESTKT